MQTILLLTVSNIFMTIAWYGHLKYKDSPLWIVILVSWGIAFVEYCFQVRRIELATTVQRRPIENYPGSDYPGRVLHLLGGLSERRVEMELSGWFCHDDRCRVCFFKEW